jgi:hypothetical protein
MSRTPIPDIAKNYGEGEVLRPNRGGQKVGLVVHPQSNFPLALETTSITGIDPRHSLSHLSLLPSGPDEVHDRLLRGGRSVWSPSD